MVVGMLMRPALIAVEDLIPQAGHSQELIELLSNVGIIFSNETSYRYKIPDFQTTVQILAMYLRRVCGSVPPGFRIIVKGKDGNKPTSYRYYNADPLNNGL